MLEPRGAQAVHRQAHDFGLARGAIVQAQQLRTRLEELGGTVRLGRLMAEDQTVVADAGGNLVLAFTA